MSRSLTRRGLIAAVLAGGTGAAGLSPLNGVLEGVAPLSGGAYRETGSPAGDVESPYGAATVTYDDHHVPHVAADTEAAAYFAVGYAQAADRLFQMELFRRSAAGRLAEVLGPFAVERDRRYAKLDFPAAARAARRSIEGTDVEAALRAYADGVTAYIENEPPGVEFGLLDYDPAPWSVLDTLLVGRLVAWQYTGGMGSLIEAARRQAFDGATYRRLFRQRFDGNGVPAIGDGDRSGDVAADGTRVGRRGDDAVDVNPAFGDWLAGFEPPEPMGSNAWVVAGEYTDTGAPTVCSDPHVGLRAPPFWYEQRVTAGERTVQGVALPGAPFVAIGENDHGAWGLTALQGDVTDLYTYEVSDDGERYRYRGEWRRFDTGTRRVPVRGGADREVTVKKTVHGPFLERELDGTTHHVGVAWPGFSDVDLMVSGLYGFVRSRGLSEFRTACADLNIALNYVYADRDGYTCYQVVGAIPIRRVDGEVVRGDRVFDGSAGQAEWAGYEPYGHSTGEGFVPFEELPAAIDPDYVATGNQRPTAAPAYPIGPGFSPGLRARRIYERLDRAAANGTAMDAAFMQSVQLDTLDVLARRLVPVLLDASDRLPPEADPWIEALGNWDYRMDADSKAALLFHETLGALHELTWRDRFEAAGLGRRYWPAPWVLATLPADSDFFDGDRSAVVAEAIERALGTIREAGWTVYGDVNVASIDHWLGSLVSGFDYPDVPVGGSGYTVAASYGSSWGVGYRMIANQGTDELHTVLAGGNDGTPLSEHYHDQLQLWVGGEYRRTAGPPDSAPDLSFRGTDR